MGYRSGDRLILEAKDFRKVLRLIETLDDREPDASACLGALRIATTKVGCNAQG